MSEELKYECCDHCVDGCYEGMRDGHNIPCPDGCPPEVIA